MAIDYFILSGTYLAYGDTPASGTVQLDGIPQVIVDTAGDKIKVGPKKVTLDTSGSFSIQLPTDSTSGNSTVQGYRVTARLKHQNVDPIEFYAPAANATLNMADVTPSVVVPVNPFIGPAGPAGAPGPTGPTGAASTVPGPAGPQGLPGVNAVANDTATAGYVAGPSATKTALDSKYGPRFDVVIDLCSAPYNLSPGQDATTALQAAFDAAAADGRSTDIVFSKGGTYTINGPQQTGSFGMTAGVNSGKTLPYSAQVLMPGVPNTASQAIRVRGTTPGAHGGSGRPYNGTVLVSNATSGWVFGCRPGFERFNAEFPWTNLMPIFQDLVLVVPNDPQCGVINALYAASFVAEGVYIRTPTPGNFSTTGYALTGTTEAISLPQGLNAGTVNLRRCDIRNVPKAIRITEHTILDHVRVSFANAALVADKPGGHANTFIQLDIEDCLAFIDYEGTSTSGNGLTVVGDVDFEGQNGAGVFVKTPGPSKIKGRLSVHLTDAMSLPNVTANGVSGNAARLGTLNVGLVSQGDVGWMESWPRDNFSRYPQIPAAPITDLGMAYPSMHPWWRNTGTLVLDQATSRVSSTNGTGRTSALVQNSLAQGRTRTVKGTFIPGAGYRFGVVGNLIPSGTNANAYVALEVLSTGSTRIVGSMGEGTNAVAVSVPGVALSTGVPHTLELLIAVDKYGNPDVVYGSVDGVQVVSYQLNATNKATLVPDLSSSGNFPYVADGFQFWEATSALSAFSVSQAQAPVGAGAPGVPGSPTADVFDYWSTFGNGSPAIGALASTNLTTVANTRYTAPIKAPRDGVVTGLQWVTGGAVPGNYDVAILNDAGDILWQKGTSALPAVANTVVTETLATGVPVTSGQRFWISIVADNSGQLMKGLSPGISGLSTLADGTLFARQKTAAGPPVVAGAISATGAAIVPFFRLNVT